MAKDVQFLQVIRFGTFEVDLQSGELRKAGLKLKLTGQPFQVLAILLEHRGEIVTREELQKRLWPDTFVDIDHNLNSAINKIREALGDSAENPHFVETLPRRGYRFIAPMDRVSAAVHAEASGSNVLQPQRGQALRLAILFGACILLAVLGFVYYWWRPVSGPPVPRTLTRLTFGKGLQSGATWSPDGRFIAYESDRGGKFDIWVQQISGGDPVQVTKGPGQNWQPNWSPDGKSIVYRSEDGDGGLFVVPALGGEGLERKIATFGYYPRWSPDSSQILFQSLFPGAAMVNRFYVVRLDGTPPREVLADFIGEHRLMLDSAIWHPDGKRITLWFWDSDPSPRFWTVPIAGGAAIKTEIDPTIEKQFLAATAEGAAGGGFRKGFSFTWSPSGNALYFDLEYRGARNIWKMTINPETLRATAINRITTGSGPDAWVAISPDGKRLAFTAKSEHIQNRLFPFDASTGHLSGNGEAITSPGRTAVVPVLSRDGKKIAFCVDLDIQKWDLWEKSLLDGREAPILKDDYDRRFPQWSPDGVQLAYERSDVIQDKHQLMVWSRQRHIEEPLTTLSDTFVLVYDWSLDGKWLLVSQEGDGERAEVWMLPLASAPHAEAEARKIASDPGYSLWEPHFSPNGRWIVFNAVTSSPTSGDSVLYVAPMEGGPWTRITKGKHYNDKPRWSPDGKTIYFLSRVNGFYNIWGIHFDPAKGKPVGEPFPVSAFETPSLMVPVWWIATGALSLSQDKLVLTMEEVSGGIWMLENVDQ